jgi:hypothetical protein
LSRPRYLLVLEDYPARLRPDMPEPAPAVVRLRWLLKTLLRLYGFRCVEAKELQNPVPEEDHE